MCARKIHVHKLLFSSSQCLLRLGSLLRTQKDGGNIIFPPLPTYTWAQEADSSACGQGHATSEAGKLDSTSRGRAWPREWPPRCPTVEAEAVLLPGQERGRGPPSFPPAPDLCKPKSLAPLEGPAGRQTDAAEKPQPLTC